jgi:undecaprenyl-diphosphatase
VLGWNQQLFLFINVSADPSTWAVELARLIANSPIVVGPVLLIALWVWGQPIRRGGLLAVAMGMLVGLGINQLLGLVYFEPRPFMTGIGHTLLTHPPDNSFPSDHATFIWAMGVGLMATSAARRWGIGTCLYGAGVAWSRIYLGVHFPLDMIASMLVAVVSGGIARFGQPIVTDWILPLADGPYEHSLHALRLPAILIPRQSRKAKSTRDGGQAEA